MESLRRHMGTECGEVALVFYCSVMNDRNSVAGNTHSLAHSSLGQKSGPGMIGISAQDLPKIGVRPCAPLEFRVLLQAHVGVQDSVLCSRRTEVFFPCSYGPPFFLSAWPLPSSKPGNKNLPSMEPLTCFQFLSPGKTLPLLRTDLIRLGTLR